MLLAGVIPQRDGKLGGSGAAAIDAFKRRLAVLAAIETQHGANRAADAAEHVGVAGDAVAGDGPQQRQPMTGDVAAWTDR